MAIQDIVYNRLSVIRKTKAEWEVDNNVYPDGTLLFEKVPSSLVEGVTIPSHTRLKLSDGVNTFSNTPYAVNQVVSEGTAAQNNVVFDTGVFTNNTYQQLYKDSTGLRAWSGGLKFGTTEISNAGYKGKLINGLKINGITYNSAAAKDISILGRTGVIKITNDTTNSKITIDMEYPFGQAQNSKLNSIYNGANKVEITNTGAVTNANNVKLPHKLNGTNISTSLPLYYGTAEVTSLNFTNAPIGAIYFQIEE